MSSGVAQNIPDVEANNLTVLGVVILNGGTIVGVNAIGAGLTLNAGGTLSLATIPAGTLMGNPGTVAAAAGEIVVGTSLAITSGTLAVT
jgi:hypothetical protein